MDYDREKLHKRCKEHRIEYGEIRNEDRFIFICPEIPDEKIKIELINMIPKESKYTFLTGPKRTTTETLVLMFKALNVHNLDIIKLFKDISEGVKNKDRHFTASFKESVPDDNTFWTDIGETLSKDGYYKTWTITMGNRTVTEKTMKLTAEISKSHDIRDHAILPDDILNLKISLGKKQDVFDFIKEIESRTNETH